MVIDLNHIREHFSNDRFAAANGAVIDSVSENGVECSMQLNADHYNSVGGVQGGAIFTLSDFAFAVHSNLAWVCGDDVGVTVAQSCSITYLNSTKGRRLTARSSCLSRGRTISVYSICVEDDLGVRISEMLATGYTLNR